MRVLPAEMQADDYICQAAELCEEAAFTPEELAAYEKYWDIIRTEKTLYHSALLKGKAIGMEEGAKMEKEKAVINSFKAGNSIETIAVFTGLTAEQIVEILKINHLI